MWGRGRANSAGNRRSFLWLPLSRPCSQPLAQAGQEDGQGRASESSAELWSGVVSAAQGLAGGARPHQRPSPLSGWPAPSSPPGPRAPGPGGSRGGSACREVCRAQSPPLLAETARAPPAHRRRCTPAGSPRKEVTPVGQGLQSTAPARPLSRPFPSPRALRPTVSLRPESCPGSKAQTKCHPLPTLPPLRASSPPPERRNVNPLGSNIINEHIFSPLVDYRFLTGRITSWSLQLLAQSPGSIKGLITSVEEMNALTHNAIIHSLCIVQTEGDSAETLPGGTGGQAGKMGSDHH